MDKRSGSIIEDLSHRIGDRGRVSLVEPGFVNTPIGEASPEAQRELPAYNDTRKRMLAKFGRSLKGDRKSVV